MASFKPSEEVETNYEETETNSEGMATVYVKYNQPTTSNIRLVQEDLVSETSSMSTRKWPESVANWLNSVDNQHTHQISQKPAQEFMDRLYEEDTTDVTSISSLRPVKKCNTNAALLANLSRSPVKCPVTSCRNTIGITSVLSHFLRDHQIKFHADLQEVSMGKHSVHKFDEARLTKRNENVCLGLLAYAGKSMYEDARPGIVGLCRTNAFLPQKYSQLVNHLPIFILACKTSLTSMLEDRELAQKLRNLNDPMLDVMVIWLATVETVKPIHCTITACNNENWTSRSVRTQVQRLKQPQEPHNFMAKESNYLRLTRGEIDILSDNPRKEIELEVLVHEFDE